MRRRALLACAPALAIGRARAQAPDRTWRIGVLRPGSPPEAADDTQHVGLPNALRALGYVEGRNLRMVVRWAGGDAERLPTLARELAAERVDVVVAVGAAAVRAMMQLDAPIPIVMYGNFDPVALGLVASLARPGGRVTGMLIAPDGTLAGKRLELLKAALPQVRRIALLAPDDEDFALQARETQQAARALGLALPMARVRGAAYDEAFAAIARERAEAVVVGAHQFFLRDRRRIIELANAQRLPAMYEWREHALDGGLMSYSTSLPEVLRRVADYVDRILRGAAPAGMPIERPARFELVINLRTARAIGLALPRELLLRADEVIE